jgi:sec-independent protein translocase protein TatA
MPGPGELLIILLIVLLIFGAGKLPAIGDALGRSIKNFKRAATGDNEIEVGKTREVSTGAKRSELKGSEVDDEAEVLAARKSKAAADDEG